MRKKDVLASYFRNFIFGVEDSLVSTVGLLSGVTIAGTDRQTIILTGLVLIFVEAFSMGAGSFLSEHSADDYKKRKISSSYRSGVASIIMFFSYFIAGFIPLFPYLVTTVSFAFWASIALSLASLFVLGVVSGKISHVSASRIGMRMLIIGGIAVALGALVGRVFIVAI